VADRQYRFVEKTERRRLDRLLNGQETNGKSTIGCRPPQQAPTILEVIGPTFVLTNAEQASSAGSFRWKRLHRSCGMDWS
jgi:hypothetical protein